MEATSTKLYNLANYSIIAIPLRRQNENSWIREPWTATHYSFNDEMCGICILSNYICCPVNVMDIFNFPSQLRRSHSQCTPLIVHDVLLACDVTQKPLGMHHIHTKQYLLLLSKLRFLNNYSLAKLVTNPNAN